MTLQLEHVKRDARKLRRLPVNARFMKKETYDTLVATIAQDGVLTDWPLLWRQPGVDDEGAELIISGNHRCDAAVDAGVFEIDAILLDAPDMQAAERIARQLAHNAISGDDDAATLKLLYEQIDDIDWRRLAGLDDKTLGLLEKVETESLSEANLDYQLVNVLFLPPELERAKVALDAAKAMGKAEERWGAALPQYETFMDALETARGSFGVGNVATAIGIILAVFEAHLGDMKDGWFDEETGLPRGPQHIPAEVIFTARTIPADAAAIIQQAIDRLTRLEKRANPKDKPIKPWRALELLCADWLSQP